MIKINNVKLKYVRVNQCKSVSQIEGSDTLYNKIKKITEFPEMNIVRLTTELTENAENVKDKGDLFKS